MLTDGDNASHEPVCVYGKFDSEDPQRMKELLQDEQFREFLAQGNASFTPIPSERVKLKLSDLERKRRKAIYRKEYRLRPQVQAAIKKRNSDPEVILRRRNYARDPEVQSRKRELARRRRLTLRLFETDYPELYTSVREKAIIRLNESKAPKAGDWISYSK